MKFQILGTALILAAIASTPASAMISKQNLSNAINSATSNGNVTSVVNGDTVTLFGVVESIYDANQARQAALSIDGVNKVVNQVTTSH